MDRLNQLRGEAGGSGDSTLDTSSPPSEAFLTANESTSKYFSLSEVDSTFDISPIKDISLASASVDSEKTITGPDQLISNLSPIGKKSDFLDTYKIGKQIEAANILSGGVDIFDDNDNSYDGNELVIDDNAEIEEKSNPELKLADPQYKDENSTEATLVETDAVPSKDTEVILQIDGKNVDAIDIGNGLYLYRKEGQEELAAVQIVDDDQNQPSFKFLKVRENAEGNLEVYEEIQIEVPNEVPIKEEKVVDKNISHVPIKDINKVMSDSVSNKIAERKIKSQSIPKPATPAIKEPDTEPIKEIQSDSKSESNVPKKMKFSDSRKSPVIGSFTPMTFHSTPNKEGRPLTKTMVDLQLHPNRHSDNVKKTIEVHTDNIKQRSLETSGKPIKDSSDDNNKQYPMENDVPCDKSNLSPLKNDLKEEDDIKDVVKQDKNEDQKTEEKELVKLIIAEESGTSKKENQVMEIINALDKPEEPEEDNQKDSKKPKQIETVDVHENMDLTEENPSKIKDIKITAGPESDKIDNDYRNKGSIELKMQLSEAVEENKSSEKPAVIRDNISKAESQIPEANEDLADSKAKQDTDNIDSDIIKEKVISDNVSDIYRLENQKKVNTDSESQSNTKAIKIVSTNDIRSNDKSVLESIVDSCNKKSCEDNNKPVENKLVEKCVEKAVKPDSTDDNKTIYKVPSDIDSLKNEVIDLHQSVFESSKSAVKNDAQCGLDSTKSQDLKKSTDVSLTSKVDNKKELSLSVLPRTDNKREHDISVSSKIDNKNEPNIPILPHINKKEQEISGPSKMLDDKKVQSNISVKSTTDSNILNDKKDNKSAPIPDTKKDIKSTTSETFSKPVSKSIATSTINVVPNTSEAVKNVSKAQTSKVKEEEGKEIKNQDNKPTIQQDIKQNIPHSKVECVDKNAVPKITEMLDQKSLNNNHAAVPFGKWTEVNRQAFLNRIKESKVPTNSSNGKQIKNSNDLNRRDVLKKIDSQRQAQELANMNRLGVKKEPAFASKTPAPRDNKVTKTEIPILKNNVATVKKITKHEPVAQPAAKPQTVTTNTITTAATTTAKKETVTQRKEINNQDLIDKTIEGIINRAVPTKTSQEEVNQTSVKDPPATDTKSNDTSQPENPNTVDDQLAQIEMKMNELHGIPFIERPPHELPYAPKSGSKSLPKSESTKAPAAKPSKIPNLLPFVAKVQKGVKENVIDVDSEEEVIEHEPITGDMDLNKKNIMKLCASEKTPLLETMTLISADSSKKETIITENDFDKFVRRNSINYENCLTVNFDSKESHHNFVQTVVQKDSNLKTYSKADAIQCEAKVLSPRKHEQFSQSSHSKPIHITKIANIIGDDDCNKNYQSKVKMAYQTAMTAKRQLERPITIIEDRPVKVVYMDSNPEYVASQLNVQGQDLSPAKKISPSNDLVITQINDSLDSDTLDSTEDGKVLDDTKVKTKHQRKQVLTPVETPELELIAPDDLGIGLSPKKKRRTEEKVERQNTKALVPKKTYLLGRGNITDDTISKPFDLSKNLQKETPKPESPVVSAASAIDSLVKAAELLETQDVNMTSKSPDAPQTPESQQNTPAKRGRGRPRKYPLPEGAVDKTKVPSPQKKPRLIDAKVVKYKDSEDEIDTSDDEMVKENWTMGKINENIVCPICNKLFRSENVVFKHVKHCTGPSPSRSDSDKSPRRFRDSQESETKSFESKSDEMDIDEPVSPKDVRKKRKSKDSHSKSVSDKDDIIVIEDTPIKPKIDKREENKSETRKMVNKNKVPDKISSLVCEFCGKTFRQLSYLVNHKLQHGKDDVKKNEEDSTKANKSVFSCEVCKKEFRKLHHLVQHRIIHNPNTTTAKLSRKSSSEQSDNKSSKDHNSSKPIEDQSAGFRCEPCDKSFRKLHHLVEHRETHDGINRQKAPSTVQTNTEKLPPPPQCDICKKTFRKLHHLIEHKEQHLETSSEKSDDKSIKSSLSTKDIIHECSLCYMVFPNEHSLNKHTIICQRKKRQSATKQIKHDDESDKAETDKEIVKPEENKLENDDDVTIVMEDIDVEKKSEKQEIVPNADKLTIENKIPIVETASKPVDETKNPIKESLKPEDVTEKENNKITEIVEPKAKIVEVLPNVPVKIKKVDTDKEPKPKVQDTPRKKTPIKDKVAHTVTKRHKPNLPLPVIEDTKPVESSDDDEIRYMLNPDFKFEDDEGKLFMKVRANKRNSLQIERPNSKDLVKRRISLQHPPKVPRLKQKSMPNKTVSSNATINTKTTVKPPKLEPVPSTDSDDSDVKYSFPEPSTEKVAKTLKVPPDTSSKESAKKIQRKSLAEKRKTLSSIAKRKSLGKAVGAKHKAQASPLKQIRKRTTEIEHRCDCGQLFSSAALLSRHTTLAHTPPRIRRRRSPLPEVNTKTIIKPAPRKPIVAAKNRPSADSRKSSVKSDSSNPIAKPNQPSTKRKSSIIKTEPKTPNETRKSPKSSDKTESVKSAPTHAKLRRYAAHKGVPVPEKMRKLMEKSKK